MRHVHIHLCLHRLLYWKECLDHWSTAVMTVAAWIRFVRSNLSKDKMRKSKERMSTNISQSFWTQYLSFGYIFECFQDKYQQTATSAKVRRGSGINLIAAVKFWGETSQGAVPVFSIYLTVKSDECDIAQ